VDFQKVEIVFYSAVSLLGIVGGVVRLCRDNVNYGVVGNLGRCLSSGLVAFGVVGIWIGPNTSSLVSPFYYLAVSALVGYVSPDIQERVINRLIEEILKRVGLAEQKKVD
jgi:hypothetical protein